MVKNRQHGFTLLEVMIAMAILAVALMAILNFQSTAVIASGRAQNIGIATMLAQHQMAHAILGFEKEFKKGKLPDDRSESGDFSDMGYPNFRWEVAMRRAEIPPPPISAEAAGDLVVKIADNIAKQISESTREVKLTVSWKELSDQEESIEVTTHIVNLKGTKVGV